MKKLSIILPILLIGSFLFYWYQVRPAIIKHDCSWVKKHSGAISYRPTMTQAELEAKGIIRTCNNDYALSKKLAPNFVLSAHAIPPLLDSNYSFEQREAIWNAISCREDSDRVIAEYKNPIKAVPAKDWYERATPQEYQFCLHDNGL